MSTLAAERTLDAHKYPVLTLPNEITSEIFLHFLPVYPQCPPVAGLHSPTNLTLICRKWRAIALATPTLWRAVYLSLETGFPFVQQIHIFDIWLHRSLRYPISVTVKENDHSTVARNFVFSSAQCARLEYLKITLILMDPPFLGLAGPMPLLHHLELVFENMHDPDPIIFGEAPLLRSVVLNDNAASIFVLPWAQLTSLTLDHVWLHECVPVLQQTSNLVYCKLNLLPYNSGAVWWPDVTLSCLKSLSLVPGGDDKEIKYLETIIVPALRELQIEEEILENPIGTLESFISKSGCRSRAFPSVKFSFDEKFVREGADMLDVGESPS
ncbi:hypothetical protein C8F04DRAFT_1085367, partial [Mycena alexandri]